MEERKGRGIPAPLARIIPACIVLFAAWLLFAQIAPRMMMHPHPMPAAITPPPASTPPAKPASETPVPEKTIAAVAEPVQLKPLQTEEAAPEAKPVETSKQQEESLSAATLQALEAKVAEQAKAIEALQQQQTQSLHTIALMDAYDRLEEHMRSGQPYADELSQLRIVAANDATLAAPLAALGANAPKGIPSLDALEHDFNHALHSVLHPPLPADAGFFARLEANLSQSVSIRRVGDVPGASSEAIIARAETALIHNDVPRSLSELSALPLLEAQAMRPWVEEATSYARRDDMLSSLKSAITTLSARSP